MFTPKHRRGVFTSDLVDHSSDARCIDFGFSSCDGGVCPRHNPVAYAEMMARHATDSITYRRVESDREARFHNFGVTR